MTMTMHLPVLRPRAAPMRFNGTATAAASSVAAVLFVGSLVASALAMRQRAIKRRQLRHRVASAALHAIHVGVRRSTKGVHRVGALLSR